MRIQHIITISVATFAAIFVVGCSKGSSSQSQSTAPTNAAQAGALMTNTLDVLQVRYQEYDKQIRDAETQLDLLRKSYKTNDQPYLDEQHKLEQMIEFQKQLAAKIEAGKLDAQFKAQGTH